MPNIAAGYLCIVVLEQVLGLELSITKSRTSSPSPHRYCKDTVFRKDQRYDSPEQ